jgi:DNA-binding transcriptional regulator YiaG
MAIERKWSQSAIMSFREDLEMTQEEFAFEVGVSIRTLQRWENGKFLPDRYSINELNKAWRRHLRRTVIA